MPKKLEQKRDEMVKISKVGIRRCGKCRLRAHKSQFLSFLVKEGKRELDKVGESGRHVYFCIGCVDLKNDKK